MPLVADAGFRSSVQKSLQQGKQISFLEACLFGTIPLTV